APAPQPTAPSSSGGTLPMAPTDGQNVSPPAAPAPPPEKAPAELPTSPAPPQLPPAPTTRWGDQDVPPMVVPTVGELPEINISG
ncbi:MAG TPA: hypothetical protein PKI05_08715, partial [Thermogutta sp.]|nr:hypothetical protein [Thermogutta sp.]